MPITYLAYKGTTEEELPGENQPPITVIDPEDEEELGRALTVRDSDCGDLNSFSTMEELAEYANTTTEEIEQALRIFTNGWTIDVPWIGFGGFMLTLASSTDTREYSNTNIQVAGVDEPDTVKTDGEYIYVMSGDEIVILKAYPGEDARVLSKIEISPRAEEMFVSDSKLVLYETAYTDYGRGTFVKVYDISDRSVPELVQNVSINGRYTDARLIGDHVYTVFTATLWEHVYLQDPWRVIEYVKLPVIVNNGEINEVAVPGLCHFDEPAQNYRVTLVTSLNLKDKTLNYKVYLTDQAQEMYVSAKNIYLAGTTYPHMGDVWTPSWGWRSVIHKISIDEGKIQYVANGTVPGYIEDQFWMDEFKGYFRVVTEQNGANVYTLNGNMETVGVLEDLGLGENLHSVRFMGTRCYLVTFKKIDPFFVIDLADPKTPNVLGELKIPGYSDYLHPYDVNHIIGLGKDAVDMGSFAWYQGVKLSMFDVTDVYNPVETSTFIIGDRGTSSAALYDHKAFMFSISKNLLIIPIDLFEIEDEQNAEPNTFGEFVWQGAYVFSVTADDGFELRGKITHFEAGEDLVSCHWSWGWRYQNTEDKNSCVFRSLYIEDTVYTISEGMVKANWMDTLAEIKAIEL
jgi:uncharacterized secreted protein with C-terminal beta-propeller domain